MKLKYDKLLSSFAFNFNLRRYIKDCGLIGGPVTTAAIDIMFARSAPKGKRILGWEDGTFLLALASVAVGRCRLTVSKPDFKRAWFQRLKLKCDESLSNFAFNFNLRRYTEAEFKYMDVKAMEKCMAAGPYDCITLSPFSYQLH